MVETDEIGEWGPPEWVVKLDGSRCDLRQSCTMFQYQCHRQFQWIPAEAGIYQLQQPGKMFQFEILAGENYLLKPRRHPFVGPHVLKQDHQEQVMLTPVRSWKEVRLDLTGLNISNVADCAPFVTTSHEGWRQWLNLWYVNRLARSRRIREIGAILGATGLATGALEAIDIERLANKIGYVSSGIQKLGDHITSSLAQLGVGQNLIADILPF